MKLSREFISEWLRMFGVFFVIVQVVLFACFIALTPLMLVCWLLDHFK